jgi:2-phosphosulfolactate phosphatase
MPRLNVHLLPDLVAESELAGATVVVIDVLRATTSIAYALAAGAAQVIPCLEIDDARRTAAKFPREQVLLGGERGGVRIEGFDLANSPEEYSREVVAGKTIVFTTTNGTRAMMRCRQAERVFAGAIANLSATVSAIAAAENVHLVCAGTEGEISLEDTLLAGWIVDRRLAAGEPLQQNDSALLALHVFRSITQRDSAAQSTSEVPSNTLVSALATGLGGRNVVALGRQRDIEAAARVDAFDFVPELDLEDWALGRS